MPLPHPVIAFWAGLLDAVVFLWLVMLLVGLVGALFIPCKGRYIYFAIVCLAVATHLYFCKWTVFDMESLASNDNGASELGHVLGISLWKIEIGTRIESSSVHGTIIFCEPRDVDGSRIVAGVVGLVVPAVLLVFSGYGLGNALAEMPDKADRKPPPGSPPISLN